MDKNYLEIINPKKQLEISNIKKWNEYTSQYGLLLSDKQIQNILNRRKEVLKETGRVEFRGGIIEKLIKEFCDSQYIDQENYESTLYELLEIFYEYKNETMDLVTDEELIKFMKKSFDGVAQGDLEYLAGTVMGKMKENVLRGKPLDYSDEKEEGNE